MRLLSKTKDPLPLYATDRRADARRQLTARNALTPFRLALARLRRPSIVAVLCLLLLAGYLIVKEERHRAKGFLAAEQNALRPGRTAVPDDAARLALADRTREKVLRRLLAGFDGLGGYFLGEDDATADARQPAFVAPDTEEGRALQASKAGIYGSAGVEWSSGVSGVGIYLGQLDYAKGFPHTSEIRPDRTVDAKGKTALETAIESIVRRSPVVVFSKTTCPYSLRAKALFSSLDLRPAPFVVEVDQRSDTGDIKALLGRLTGHSTWPNVFIAGRHIGGSDDLQHVSTEGLLKGMLAEAGAFSRGAG